MSLLPLQLTPEAYEKWYHGFMVGDPAEARSYVEQAFNPKFIRINAGGGRTDFERLVQKITYFRQNCKQWNPKVNFLIQDGNRVAVHTSSPMALGDEPAKEVELMIFATRDELGRFLKVSELMQDVDENRP